MNVIQKFLERKDYVGATFIAMATAIFIMWGRIVELERQGIKLQQEYEKQVRIATAAQQAREDRIRDEARKEVSVAYRAAFQNQEDRIASLELIIETLSNKSTIVNSKYNRLQRQINTVSGNQQKIEKEIR